VGVCCVSTLRVMGKSVVDKGLGVQARRQTEREGWPHTHPLSLVQCSLDAISKLVLVGQKGVNLVVSGACVCVVVEGKRR